MEIMEVNVPPNGRRGLGFRALTKVMETFGIKFAWNFLTSNSLWASFLWNKYIKLMSLLTNDLPIAATRYWKNIWSYVLEIVKMPKWDIGRGDIRLLYENLSDKGYLCDTLEFDEDNVCISIKEVAKDNFVIPGLTIE